MPRDPRPFITVHDGMPEHPKIEPLSDAAFRLLVTSWCWCSRNRTNGKLPGTSWAKRGTAKARKELLDCGLAERLVSGDVLMHDYLEHQRSAAEIDELSAKRRQAGSKGGKAKATGIANAKANASDGAKQPASKDVADTEGRDRTVEVTQEGERNVSPRASSATEPTCSQHPLGDGGTNCGGCARVREWRDRNEANAKRARELDRTAALLAEQEAARAAAAPRPKALGGVA